MKHEPEFETVPYKCLQRQESRAEIGTFRSTGQCGWNREAGEESQEGMEGSGCKWSWIA